MKIRIIALLILIALVMSLAVSCSKKDDSDNDNNVVGSSDKTLLTAAEELANEVDNIPKLEEIVLPKEEGLVIKEAAYDYSEDKLNNQIVSAYDKFQQVDSIVDSLKLIKNQCLSLCRSLNTWVTETTADNEIAYKLNYDVTNNVVTVEQRSNFIKFVNTYYYMIITVSYDGEGKLLIDYYKSDFNNSDITYTEQIHYLEDNYFCHMTKRSDEFTERMNFYDLKNNVWAETLMGYVASSDGNGGYNVKYSDPIVSYHYFKDGYYVNNGGDNGDLYFDDGRLIGQWSTTFGSNYSLNLNLFDGWTSIDQYDDKVKLNSSVGEVICPAYDNLITDDFKYRVTWFDGWPWPNFSIRSLEDEVWSADKTKENFIAASELFGISGAESIINFIVDQSFEYDKYHDAFHYMNGLYGPDLNSETFYLLVDMMSYETFTYEDLLAVFDTPAIYKDSQTEEYEYFEFIEFSIEGKAVVSSDGKTLSLDSFKATCQPSLLLKDNEEYSLVFVFASPTSSVELGKSSAYYNGSALVIDSDASVISESYPKGYGEYILKVYLADNNSSRISKSYVVTAEIPEGESVSADLSSEELGSELTAESNIIKLYNYIVSVENETKVEIENKNDNNNTK